MENINYFREYIQSKLHIGVGLGTLGVGLLSGSWLVLIVGIVLYGLSFMFMHELPFFKKAVDKKYQEVKRQEDLVIIQKFKMKMEKQLFSLTLSRQSKYTELAKICKEIQDSTLETISTEDAASDMRLKKIDDLVFFYLKLLCVEQSIQIFLETERKEDINSEISKAYEDVKTTTEEINSMDSSMRLVVESKQRLLVSYTDKLEVLKKRLEKIEQAKVNIKFVEAEQSRLNEQVKLLRADAVASRNADAISSRIDASVQNLDETNKWLSTMNDFKDVVGDTPSSNIRIGFDIPEAIESASDTWLKEEKNRVIEEAIGKKKVRVSRLSQV